jgi:hypothetical protein
VRLDGLAGRHRMFGIVGAPAKANGPISVSRLDRSVPAGPLVGHRSGWGLEGRQRRVASMEMRLRGFGVFRHLGMHDFAERVGVQRHPAVIAIFGLEAARMTTYVGHTGFLQ